MYDTNISYKKKVTDKMYWDKWGKSYRIEKGRQLVSLSNFKKKSDSQSSTNVVVSVHSTVTDLTLITTTPFLTFIYYCKINKKGQITEGEYSDFDIRFGVRS